MQCVHPRDNKQKTCQLGLRDGSSPLFSITYAFFLLVSIFFILLFTLDTSNQLLAILLLRDVSWGVFPNVDTISISSGMVQWRLASCPHSFFHPPFPWLQMCTDSTVAIWVILKEFQIPCPDRKMRKCLQKRVIIIMQRSKFSYRAWYSEPRKGRKLDFSSPLSTVKYRRWVFLYWRLTWQACFILQSIVAFACKCK